MALNSDNNNPAEQLAKLSKLHADGVLTADEFRALKGKLIARIGMRADEKVTSDLENASEFKPVEELADNYASESVSILLDESVLRQFVTEDSLVYYKSVFEKLIDGYGIRNCKLSDLDDKRLGQIAFQRGAKIASNVRLPFVNGTIWNWSAFFFGIFWAVWRGIAYQWWIFAVWVVALLFSGFSVFPSLAIPIFLGANGNALFLSQVLRELKLGSVRPQPNFPLQMIVPAVTSLALLFVFGINGSLFSSKATCSSSNVIQTVKELMAKPKPMAEALLPPEVRQAMTVNPSDIELGDIVTRSQNGNVLVCSATFVRKKLTAIEEQMLQGVNPEQRDALLKQGNNRIGYTVQPTDDGRIYVQIQTR